MASKHYTESGAKAKKQEKLTLPPPWKPQKDAKDHNKAEHKDHPFETPIERSYAVASNPTHGAAQTDFAPGTHPGTPKPLKDSLKDFLLDHKVIYFDTKFSFDGKHHHDSHLVSNPGLLDHRLQALEVAVGSLLHFIPQDLRPDLSHGALMQETDVAPTKAKAKKKAAKPSSRSAKKTPSS